MNKLIQRKVIDDIPVKIEYTLTDHAKSLGKVIQTLHGWGKEHRKAIFEQ